MLNVIRVLNPFDPGIRIAERWEYKGLPMSGYFNALEPEYVISINGKIVAYNETDLTFPQSGDCIVICPIPPTWRGQ